MPAVRRIAPFAAPASHVAERMICARRAAPTSVHHAQIPEPWSLPLTVTRRLSAAAALGLAGHLGGCAVERPSAPPARPAFYVNLGEAGARLDVTDAVQTINLYRARNGLAPLHPDAKLQALASASASAMARRDAPASADGLRRNLAGRGVAAPMVNMSAGYRSMAEAFSGWRASPAHDATMRNPRATRVGIAAANARQGSRYRVYWTLITAGAAR